MDEQQKIIIPALYRYFKTQRIYATMGISNPMPGSFIESIKYIETCETMYATDTEDKYTFEVYYLNGEYYHHRIKNRQYILYKSLHDSTGIKAKETSIFCGHVNKEKYPKEIQRYRFELVRY